MTKRFFTPAAANRTLPLVRKIVADILTKGDQYRRHAALEQNDEVKKTLKKLDGEMAALLHELESLGCFYKDWNFNVGLVDFPAFIDGEPVFLCWRSDEERITWYHGIEDGFAGRTPIPEDLLVEEEPAEA